MTLIEVARWYTAGRGTNSSYGSKAAKFTCQVPQQERLGGWVQLRQWPRVLPRDLSSMAAPAWWPQISSVLSQSSERKSSGEGRSPKAFSDSDLEVT